MSLMEDYQCNPETFFKMAGCYNSYDVCAAFILQEVRLYRNKNGGQNMACTLRNCKGTIAGICFDYGGTLDESSAGTPVMVQGRMGSYKGAPQIRIFDIWPLDADDAQNDIRPLLPHGLLSGEEGFKTFRDAMVAKIQDGDYLLLCKALVDENKEVFSSCPASTGSHHACVGGLLTPTYEVMEWAYNFAEYYNDTYDFGIDRELLTAGAVLHDIGKVREYGFDSAGAAMRPTEAMKENAHALEGAMMIREMAQELGTPEDKARKLENLVASHHTAYPFRVGVSPITPEAKLLAVVDNLDSSVSSNFGKDVVFLDGKPVHIQDVA